MKIMFRVPWGTTQWNPAKAPGEAEDLEPLRDADAFTWAASGSLLRDGRWVYVFDAEDRLVSVASALQTNGAVRVLNRYDHRHRRISKTVQRFVVTTNTASALQPSNASAGWETRERRDFVYDDWNLIHETVTTVDANAITNVSEVQYFWGPDLSNTLQGAGGVGGLLAVSMEGSFYFPVYDNNGNIVKYVDETGSVVASYEYDDFGGTLSSGGSLAENFAFRFSTKYYDEEVDFCYFGNRFYSPHAHRWINRDPDEEYGGRNVYAYCLNSAIGCVDYLGRFSINYVSYEGDEGRTRIYEVWSLADLKTARKRIRGNGFPWGEYKYARGKFIERIIESSSCKFTIQLGYEISPFLSQRPKRGMRYMYYPHYISNQGMGQSVVGGETSDDLTFGMKPLDGGVLAHESGHAEIFFEETKGNFESSISQYLEKDKLSNAEIKEVERLFEKAIMDSVEHSLQRANEKSVFWHKKHGFKVTRGEIEDDGKNQRLSRRPYLFDY